MSENKKHPHRATIDLLVDSDILPIPLTILWGQKVRNWAFEALWFLKKATYQKSKKSWAASMTALFLPEISCSSVQHL